MDRFRVAVLRGGWSSEREVSMTSGQAVIDALKRQMRKVTDKRIAKRKTSRVRS